MTTVDAPTPDDRTATRNVAILVLAQAFLGAQMPMLFTIAGLAGQSLASNPCWATLPISLIVAGSMVSATPLSAIMQRWGRTVGFVIGAMGGALGGIIGAYGLYLNSFPVFLLGSFFTGIYMCSQGFFRFAAADTASEDFRPKAISYVMAGGLISAIIGPQLVKATTDAYVIPFFGSYLAVVVINVVGALLFAFLRIPAPAAPGADAPKGRSRTEMLRTPRIAVAIICGMVAYALMNLVMTSTPLAVVGCGFTQGNAADVVTFHVLAMFVPSFFTGHLIARFGVEKIMGAGILILGAAGAVALQGVDLANFFAALILLGLGWNFGFIGATTMLASAHTPEERGRIQGMNDLFVFGGVTVASLASGGLMNCSGGSPIEGWTAVNMAMAPFLMLSGGALIWLVLRPQESRA
ncbi:Major Facilitator Superfamily protein [Tritonibacter multivorans]|uniref:Major Facilitator Superfamily protein n=1 Tax=Tritonibacter multivorans TaxID=928856 RepID=A0A0P1GIE6_9RHOB|nr:MFS transporter [Tritonibacter multivorans]MDA7420328.1 MFS transporter [Tritonibacter multivorans]CUH81808.1 Major Facilitator Superfamily protein [Tritonibacter multivorans]SFC44156.1 Predicted arabinose efflux permease, MFS family [Tritonibacter multivorans]